MSTESATSAFSGFQINGNPTPEEVAAIVAALSIVTARQSARSDVNATSPWGTPILRTPLNGAWGAPQFR
ncbi:MAG: acyl-CoA carboxylase subunit epsilon [Actinobacteria bacterium]|nr:acyl-CoA carboxylase subunit epsilon [Actinomycetota bacterium]